MKFHDLELYNENKKIINSCTIYSFFPSTHITEKKNGNADLNFRMFNLNYNWRNKYLTWKKEKKKFTTV